MLYWGEGYKRGGEVSFSNSDPRMIKVFLRFLRHVCGVHEERLRMALHYYQDHNPKELMTFWSEQTQIPALQFHTPYLHVRNGGTYRELSRYGTATVHYADKKLLKQILTWITDYYSLTNSE